MSTPRIKHCEEIKAQVVLPDNSGYTWLFDSTYLEKSFMDADVNGQSQLGKSASVPSPGPQRGCAKNCRVMMTISVATNSASLVRYRLDGAEVWRLYSTTALNAGDTPQSLTWDISSPDALIGVLAGAAAPTAIATTFLLKEQP